MGYRSEVGLALTKAGVASLTRKLQTVSEERRTAAAAMLGYAEIHYIDGQSGAEAWGWSWLKWYPEFLDVSVIEELMDAVEYEDFRFIRIGEEDDDIETRGGFRENPFNMDLQRGISLEEPKQTILADTAGRCAGLQVS